MKKLTKKWQMIIYACSAFGVNLLNTIMGSYLCSALLTKGFETQQELFNKTYIGKDLVIPIVWSAMALIAKILDGVIDIPMASFTDRLRTRWGRRRPSLIIGMVPMILAFVMFLFVPQSEATLFNTLYYGIVLCIFYSFYTLTMVTYYATFSEIVSTQKDRDFISNVKSVCDIMYFIVGYVAVVAMLDGMNIRKASIIILPIVLTMLIPLFMIKENPSNVVKHDSKSTSNGNLSVKKTGFFSSFISTFKNRAFMLWMIVYMFLNFSSQLFLSGIGPYFSSVGMSMILVMIAAFAPVPFTLVIFNKIQKKFGFGMAIRYTLAMFGIAMIGMFCVGYFIPNGTIKTIASIFTGLFSSLAIGSIFSVGYSVPSELAAQDSEKNGVSNSAMFFAVQGLFAGVSAGIGAGLVSILRGSEDSSVTYIKYMTLISGLAAFAGIFFTFFLPRAMKMLGKENKNK